MLDEKSIRRVGDATRKSESQRTDHTSPAAPRNLSQQSLVRFKLRSPLEHGKFAIGRMMALERNDDGSFYWLQTDREDSLFLATGHQTRIDAGAEVTAILTAAGYAVVSETLMARTGGAAVIPYGVYPIGHTTATKGVLLISGGGLEAQEPWERDYAFLGDVPEDPPTQERSPDQTANVSLKLWPCTVQLPTWVAYSMSPDTGLPQDVLDALEWGNQHPRPGEHWGTPSFPRLQRTASLLELYWYKWTPPPPTCNLNPDYDPISDPGSPDYDPDSPDFDIGYDASTPKGFWAGTTVECDPDDPGDPPDNVLADPVWWVAPVGWWGWGFGGWGWGFGWNGIGWNYPAWYAGAGSAYHWGAWGYGWWINRWGGRPPTAADLPDPDGPVPQPPPGQGEITRECRYGWVVWQWCWRILNVDEERQLAFIIGEIEFFNRLIVQNGTYEDCPDPYAT